MLIPIIDLFAGPGGLGEGFSSLRDGTGHPVFKIALSIEMEENARKTLRLRSFFRQFAYRNKAVPDDYYRYIRNEITEKQLFQNHQEEFALADREAWQAKLGGTEYSITDFDTRISKALQGSKDWVLIGGPPCQAYSLVGRARQTGLGIHADAENADEIKKQLLEKFNKNEKHKLYREYLRIIAKFSPAVFVMENVKGILSAKWKEEPIFPLILSDLKNPGKAVEKYFGPSKYTSSKYVILSFVKPGETLTPLDYVIQSEKFGIPQARHRVILLGIKKNFYRKVKSYLSVLQEVPEVSLESSIGNLPKLRSGISSETDTFEAWQSAIKAVTQESWINELSVDIREEINKIISQPILPYSSRGGRYVSSEGTPIQLSWERDVRLDGVFNHETRTHMPSDIIRYLFASCFCSVNKYSPKLNDFPKALLPAHKNTQKALTDGVFSDRFRVQTANRPATTITSHISKDGHYYIHPDPLQCRSLTVREAARIQTFPDNYFFEGGRTAQYLQVGNAVPPLLARQIAEIVKTLFAGAELSEQCD